ncbi:hypothetical protein AAUPMB_08027, partial [Pasteurella multocida subsp. multocida str. Anand1_buffalo]
SLNEKARYGFIYDYGRKKRILCYLVFWGNETDKLSFKQESNKASSKKGKYMHNQTLITVRDVQASTDWYTKNLGLAKGHGGAHYEQLIYKGKLILQLHNMDPDENHGALLIKLFLISSYFDARGKNELKMFTKISHKKNASLWGRRRSNVGVIIYCCSNEMNDNRYQNCCQ